MLVAPIESYLPVDATLIPNAGEQPVAVCLIPSPLVPTSAHCLVSFLNFNRARRLTSPAPQPLVHESIRWRTGTTTALWSTVSLTPLSSSLLSSELLPCVLRFPYFRSQSHLLTITGSLILSADVSCKSSPLVYLTSIVLGAKHSLVCLHRTGHPAVHRWLPGWIHDWSRGCGTHSSSMLQPVFSIIRFPSVL